MFSDENDVLDFSLSDSDGNSISPFCASAAQLGTEFFLAPLAPEL